MDFSMRFPECFVTLVVLGLLGLCTAWPRSWHSKTETPPEGYLTMSDKNGFYRYLDSPIYNEPSQKRNKRVGGGHPHQRFLHKQVTLCLSLPLASTACQAIMSRGKMLTHFQNNTFCGSLPACSIPQSQDEVSTIGFSVSLTSEFSTAGFYVDESVTTGATRQRGGVTGATACIWEKIAMKQVRPQSTQTHSLVTQLTKHPQFEIQPYKKKTELFKKKFVRTARQ